MPTGDVRRDSAALLRRHGRDHTAEHCAAVAAEAGRLAERFGVPVEAARIGGWLHDVSTVIPDAERVAVAETLGLPVLPEEAAYPMILHQKLSAVLACDVFAIDDPAILSAIGCHTTLKAGASPLDLVVFTADKIAWDQSGVPPYLAALQAALDTSLAASAFAYIDYLWQRRATLRVVHAWLRDAHRDLSA